MNRLSLAALCALLTHISIAQNFLGTENFPAPQATVSLAPDFGTDFSGGYQIGDQVDNFQIYDATGTALRLNDALDNDKHTIITTGSASCIRFTQTWNLEASDPGYHIARQYMVEHADDFNWIFIYGFEAHPGDLENCTSNCPELTIPAPNGDTLFSHKFYSDRIAAIQLWSQIVSSPEYNYEFPFNFYADNPNNGVYNNFMERPFGSVVVDCEGKVLERCEWTNTWLSSQEGHAFLNGILEPSVDCGPGAFECSDEAFDSDEDGICDDQELWQGWDPYDPSDPIEVATSILDITKNELKAYPNPFDNILTLSNVSFGDQVQLWDMQGRLVHATQIQASSALNLSAINQGVYTLIVTEKSGEQRSQLVVKR